MYDRTAKGPSGFVNQLLARQTSGRRGKDICCPFTILQHSDELQYTYIASSHSGSCKWLKCSTIQAIPQ